MNKKSPIFISSIFLILIVLFFISPFSTGLKKIINDELNRFATVYSSTPNSGTLSMNGQSNVIIPDASGGYYLGGTFNFIGPYTGAAVPVLTNTGSTTTTFPIVNSTINKIVQDGSGGWYIGGSFSTVNDISHPDIVHVLSDGSVDPNFNPIVNNSIASLALSTSTGILYMGGSFTSIDGVGRNGIAAVNTSDGSLVSSFNVSIGASAFNLLLSPSGNTLYLSGQFVYVGPYTGGGVLLASSTAIATSTFPLVKGSVNTSAQDGSGGYYIGGSFTAVGATSINNIAHILSDGSVDPNFNPNVNNTVNTMALSTSTNILYLGGAFTTVGGVTRNRIAAVSIIDGSLITTFDPNANNTLNTMTLSASTSILYIGGSFTTIGGTTQNRVAAVNTSDGSVVNTFNPNTNNNVNTMALSTSTNILYLGGSFTTIGTTTRNRIAAVNTSDGSVVNSFNPNANSTVEALVVSNSTSTLYMSGFFSTIGGTTRNAIAEVNTSDGSLVTNFNPGAAGTVLGLAALALSLDEKVLYIGGSFMTIAGTARNNIAAVNTTDGSLLTGFNPNADLSVNTFALSPDGNSIYTGGSFTSIGGKLRNSIAAVNTSDGSVVNSFNPTPNGTNNISAMALSASTSILYIGGGFTTINGATHNRLAAVNTSDGSIVSAFNTAANSNVESLVLSPNGNILYAGGIFTTIAGGSRNQVAAVNTSDGTLVNAFNVNLSVGSNVLTLALSAIGDKLYVGGVISSASGTVVFNIGAVNTTDGSLAAGFNASASGQVNSVALSQDGSTLNIGGGFNLVDATIRQHVAHILSDGSVDPNFNPNVNNTVNTMALSTSTNILYLGGLFTQVGTTTRNHIAAVNTSDGSVVSSFNPNTSGSGLNVNTIVLGTSTLYLGGAFTTVGGITRNHIAEVNTSDGSLVAGFDPNITTGSSVSTMILSSSSNILYIGGSFTAVGGIARNNIAAVNTSDGSVVSTFNPSANSSLNSMLFSPDGNTLYVAGQFSTLGALIRGKVGAVNISDGSVVSAFNPNANNTVNAIFLSTSTNTLYIGGSFSTVGGISQTSLAAVNATDGSLVSTFNPNVNSTVTALSVSVDGNTLYISGGFTKVGSLDRVDFASLPVASSTIFRHSRTTSVTTVTPTTGGVTSTVVNSGTSTITATTTVVSTSTVTVPVGSVPVSAPAMPQFSFTQILKLGSTGDEVKELQIFLNTHGYRVAKSGSNGSLGHETSYFGPATKAALIKFQNAHVSDILAPQGLSSGTGIFWLYSKKVMNGIISGK